tara:strand:- start:761 stop:937 length:177 start_codon:yes stop_codon:yes gene_type:complete
MSKVPTSPDTPPAATVSLGDLAFVLDVLVPRAWVRGPEVERLMALKATLEQVLRSVPS